MKVRFCFLFLLGPFLLSAQVIEGTVMDAETNQPLEHVNIYYKRLLIGTTSDAQGNFILTIHKALPLTDSLQISYIGYENKNVPLTLFSNGKSRSISLYKKEEKLTEIVVKGKTKDIILKKSLEFKTVATMAYAVSDFSSCIVGDRLFIVGGNASVGDDPVRRAIERSNEGMNPTFESFARNLTIDISRNSYSNKTQIFDLNTHTWIKNTIAIENRAYHNMAYFDDHLYVFGGKHLSDNRRLLYMEPRIDIIDIASHAVVTDRINPHHAANFASFVYDDNIIVMGGSIIVGKSGKNSYSNEVHTYDIPTGYWYTLPSMIKAKEVKGVLVKDKIYLIGGYDGKELAEIESFDLQTGAWNQEWQLPYGISNSGLAYHKDIIYIYHYGKVIAYDIMRQFMRQFAISLHLTDASLHYFNNSLYLVGGNFESDYLKRPSSKIYKIDIDQFKQVKSNLIRNLRK